MVPSNTAFGAKMIVGVVSFLGEGGEAMGGYSKIPFELDELRRIITTDFKAKEKRVFVPDYAFANMFAPVALSQE